MVVLYTSGSTGKPKGVVLNHRGYANRFRWQQELFPVKVGDRVAQKTSCCFDVSIWELFWPLMHGAIVCPVRREVVSNPWSLAEWMARDRIQIMHFVPSLFGEFVRAIGNDTGEFRELRWLIFSGEALPKEPVSLWRSRFGNRVGLANLYGPTEASIDVTAHVLPEHLADSAIPIGRPMPGCVTVITREDGTECGIGEVGELCLGGVQLAVRYHDDPESTRKAFVTRRFADGNESIIYRTGDLAALRSDGDIEYHGRLDSQVKIRGFRVELGEIEATLNQCAGVDESAVVVEGLFSREPRLLAFVASSSEAVNEARVRNQLRTTLPSTTAEKIGVIGV